MYFGFNSPLNTIVSRGQSLCCAWFLLVVVLCFSWGCWCEVIVSHSTVVLARCDLYKTEGLALGAVRWWAGAGMSPTFSMIDTFCPNPRAHLSQEMSTSSWIIKRWTQACRHTLIKGKSRCKIHERGDVALSGETDSERRQVIQSGRLVCSDTEETAVILFLNTFLPFFLLCLVVPYLTMLKSARVKASMSFLWGMWSPAASFQRHCHWRDCADR